jgi:hypothetical protein
MLLQSCGFKSPEEVRKLAGSAAPDPNRPKLTPPTEKYLNMRAGRQRLVSDHLKKCEPLMRTMAMQGHHSGEIAKAVGLGVSREAINKRLRLWGLSGPRGQPKKG